jgi:hypothetical protein
MELVSSVDQPNLSGKTIGGGALVSVDHLWTLRQNLQYLLEDEGNSGCERGTDAHEGARLGREVLGTLACAWETGFDALWALNPRQALLSVTSGFEHLAGYTGEPAVPAGVRLFGDASTLRATWHRLSRLVPDACSETLVRETIGALCEGGRAYIAYAVWSELLRDEVPRYLLAQRQEPSSAV